MPNLRPGFGAHRNLATTFAHRGRLVLSPVWCEACACYHLADEFMRLVTIGEELPVPVAAHPLVYQEPEPDRRTLPVSLRKEVS